MKYFLLLYILFICGCVSVEYAAQAPVTLPKASGIYHKVSKGETLWRIAKAYNYDLDKLASVNEIRDSTRIEVGQLIFIPGKNKNNVSQKQVISEEFIWPLKGKVISTFGSTYKNMLNKGINIEPESGNSVIAARSGRVVFAEDNFGNYGKALIVEHSDGYSSVYARNSEILKKPGDEVKRGEPIARAGSTARDKKTYLHFQVRKGSIAKNPLFFLP